MMRCQKEILIVNIRNRRPSVNVVCACIVLFCSLHITVSAQVAANFTTDTTKGCVPLTVHCTSTENDGVINWYWTTSDGQTSTDANPVFTFTKPGRYLIKLKTSDNSVADSISRYIFANGISTRFTYRYDNICTSPVPVYFNAYDTADGNYHWDFGDSTVSIEQNPTHIYQSGGAYPIHFTTYSKEGCVDSSAATIETGKVTVDFDAPAKACNNSSVIVTSTSTSIPKSARWTVNDVVVSRTASGFTYSFTDPGTYTIKLTEDFGGCSFFKEKPITILRKPVAGFDQSGTLKSCLYPSVVQFSGASSNADSYTWNFGDGTISSEVNPAHTYVTNGQFSPSLKVSNANGCSDSLTKPNLVLLGPPIVTGLQGLPTSHCLPYTIQPSAVAISAEPIVSYDWNWGNGDHASDSAPVYTYTTKGYYDVTLITKTASGCTDTFFVQRAVSVGDSLTTDFTVDKSVACGSETFYFSGTASGKPTSWSWRFGDGASIGGQNAYHQYISTGSQTVSLIINNNGCKTTTTKNDFVFVKPPIAKINVIYDCTDQLRVNFSDASQGAATWQWNFGDGSPVTNIQNPSLHVYPASGIYTVTLSTTNDDCASTDSVIVPVLNTKPVFTFNPADGYLCRKATIQMAATNPEYIADYYWDFDDGRSAFSDTFITNYYSKAGTYYPSLVTKYKNGCYDTIYSPQPVRVTGPTASFNTGTLPNCSNKEVMFADKSMTDGEHAITSWQWTCGDAYMETRATPAFSHRYASFGQYKASLLIHDNNNCTDTAYFTVKINKLPAISAGQDTFVCDGKNKVQLAASGGISYKWNTNATLNCTDCATPVASPFQPTVYTVTGTDANGCTNTDSVQVEVIRPFNLVVNPSADICQTKSVLLNVSGADLYSWQPPVGLSSASSANPYASPDTTTTYTVTGSDAHYCFSQTGQIIVNVYPNPQFDIDTSLFIAQKGDINLLQTTGSDNIVSWRWSPALGLSCTDCAQPYATAVKTTTYTAIAATDHGCTDTDKVTIHVLCNQTKIYIPTAFTPNGDGKNDWFYVMSSVDNPVQSFVIYNRNGERIFNRTGATSNNPSQGWDGAQNGRQAPPGTYVYRIEIKCNEELVPFTGTVTVVR